MHPSTCSKKTKPDAVEVWNQRSLDPQHEAALDLLSDVYSNYEDTGVEYGGTIPSTIFNKVVKFLNHK